MSSPCCTRCATCRPSPSPSPSLDVKDEVFGALRRWVEALELPSSFTCLLDAMLADLSAGGRGRYAGQHGMHLLVEDVEKATEQTGIREAGLQLLHVASGFAGAETVAALGNMAVDFLAILRGDDEGGEGEEAPLDLQLLRVAVQANNRIVQRANPSPDCNCYPRPCRAPC